MWLALSGTGREASVRTRWGHRLRGTQLNETPPCAHTKCVDSKDTSVPYLKSSDRQEAQASGVIVDHTHQNRYLTVRLGA